MHYAWATWCYTLPCSKVKAYFHRLQQQNGQIVSILWLSNRQTDGVGNFTKNSDNFGMILSMKLANSVHLPFLTWPFFNLCPHNSAMCLFCIYTNVHCKLVNFPKCLLYAEQKVGRDSSVNSNRAHWWQNELWL